MQDFENKPFEQDAAPQSPWFAPAPSVIGEPETAPIFAEPNHETAQPEMPDTPAFTAQNYEGVRPEAPKAPVQKPARKKGKKMFGRVLAAVLVVALIVGSSGATMYLMRSEFQKKLDEADAAYQTQLAQLEDRLAAAEKKGSSTINSVSSPSVQGTPSAGSTDYMTPAQVYASNLNSVVLINNVVSSGYYTSGGTGSGFILTEDGYVVTNYHVIEGGGTLSVVTADGKEHPAELIGSDNANDVALLKIEADGLQAVTLGDSDALIVGDQVAAIGNPLGELTSTLTVGYVSAKERDVNTSGFAINMIQTDAAINSGNSGGPLFNMYGQVVGITTAKYSGSSSSGATIEGIGFAIPINDVQGLLEDLVEHGFVTGPYMGVSVSDMDSEGAAYYGLPMGAYVNDVEKDSCAQKAGVKAKDIIVKVGEYEVDSVNSLSKALRNYEAGDTVEITVYRSGAEVVLSITFDEKPREEVVTQTTPETQPKEEENPVFGFLFPDNG